MSPRNQSGRFRIFAALCALIVGFGAYTLWHQFVAFTNGPMEGIEAGETVVVERPVYVSPPAYYYAPPPRYPGVVLSVDIPPIVFPIR